MQARRTRFSTTWAMVVCAYESKRRAAIHRRRQPSQSLRANCSTRPRHSLAGLISPPFLPTRRRHFRAAMRPSGEAARGVRLPTRSGSNRCRRCSASHWSWSLSKLSCSISSLSCARPANSFIRSKVCNETKWTGMDPYSGLTRAFSYSSSNENGSEANISIGVSR